MICKAWDLMGEHYYKWAKDGYMIRLVGGRALYTDACNTTTDNIRLQRLDQDLKITTRYVAWNTPVELVYVENSRR